MEIEFSDSTSKKIPTYCAYTSSLSSDGERSITGPYLIYNKENWCPFWRKNLMFYTFWLCFYAKINTECFNGAPTKLELLAIEKLKEM